MIDQKIKEYCEKHDFIDPVELLVGLTNGVDLRKVNAAYSWIMQFEDKFGEDAEPDALEWLELKDLIKREARFQNVSSAQSQSAQRALIEYQHPKKKSIDVTANINASVGVSPLTAQEIRRFKRKFDKLV